ncbi:GNAT family N-acetyltransferase [Variovorax sp. Root411]|uniref:GNAT family N-acetyltransferase n=1 Tax=Variovorax sp. Root411 TaxID=1736530 RepID=UPI0006FA059F|nr:GNAT family N-acetyltransferase [Variovorax sp. Root411]KQW63503.1 acetyltransferase [Variovorax sp. Root411]
MHVDLVAEAQHESLIDLLIELHGFYNEGRDVSREMVRDHLATNLLAAGSPHQLAVALTDDQTVVGFAAITWVFSLVDFTPEQRKQCQLKELYVRSTHRSTGTGKALMSWVAKRALTHGCHRVDWPVKAANTRGIAFYERLGATKVADRLSYRLPGPAMGKLAGGA